MRIDWWTLALQAANFLVLVWLLQHFLYRPVQAIIADASSGRWRACRRRCRQDRGRTLRSELEEQRAASSGTATRRWRRRTPGQVEAAALLERARADAGKLLADERQRLERERAEAAEVLRLDASSSGDDRPAAAGGRRRQSGPAVFGRAVARSRLAETRRR